MGRGTIVLRNNPAMIQILVWLKQKPRGGDVLSHAMPSQAKVRVAGVIIAGQILGVKVTHAQDLPFLYMTEFDFFVSHQIKGGGGEKGGGTTQNSATIKVFLPRCAA